MKRHSFPNILCIITSTFVLSFFWRTSPTYAQLFVAWAEHLPVIDGILASGEWDDASSATIHTSGEQDAVIYVKHSSSFISNHSDARR